MQVSDCRLSRRLLLLSTAGLASTLAPTGATARTIEGKLPWTPNAGAPPPALAPGPWVFFTPEEGTLMEAVADRLIPPDPPGTSDAIPGGKDAGCAVFVDRQLAGPYGRAAGLYMRPPFMEGTKEQGDQGAATPAQRFRAGLAALDAHTRAANLGKGFHELPADAQDTMLKGMEAGAVKLDGINTPKFLELMVTTTKQGFLADPAYGGNRDMAGWRMIGFPGARYDYSDWIGRHNERYPLPPVGIASGARSTQPGRG